VNSPLLVKVPAGDGEVIFTSFHNEKANSESEIELLKYLVFTTVTAKVESAVTRTMVRGGFSPQKSSLLSTSAEAPSVTKIYNCKKRGRLQFVLSFEDRGASMTLKATAPDGKVYKKAGTSTITIDVPDAKPGKWKYTATATVVPYENFPFSLSVWQK